VYVGDHYPGDVLAGMLIGLACATLLLSVFRFVPSVATKFSEEAIARVAATRREV
jgi:membrane-associated phospholipid phosphatase